MLIAPLLARLPPTRLSNLLAASGRLTSGGRDPLMLIAPLLARLLAIPGNLDLLYSEQGSIK
jgi:hypothetical protein